MKNFKNCTLTPHPIQLSTKECNSKGHINKKGTPLAVALLNFTAITTRNLREFLPKIFNEESYKVPVIFSTLAEQTESEKIENSTTAEIKQKIFAMVENFSNQKIWLESFHQEVLEKSKLTHLYFL